MSKALSPTVVFAALAFAYSPVPLQPLLNIVGPSHRREDHVDDEGEGGEYPTKFASDEFLRLGANVATIAAAGTAELELEYVWSVPPKD